MYVCGVTPYDSAHVGHGMSLTSFDIIRRYLEHRGYKVRHVQNFTDIDDKIIDRANAEGIDPDELTERFIAEWHDRDAGAQRPAGDALSARHGGDRTDHRDGAGADRPRLRLRRSKATSTSASAPFPATASSRTATSTISSPAPASRSTSARTTRSTSRSGRPPSRASRAGSRRGGRAGPAGTSSARR